MTDYDPYLITFGGFILLIVVYVLWATFTTKDDDEQLHPM